MCGIFAVINDKTNNAAQTVLQGLKKLEYRGYDSWGIAINTSGSHGNQLMVEKHIGKIGDAKTHLSKGSIAIGHTRWATHGGVTNENAHPHLDCHKRIAVIHNGIVENYQEQKKSLIKNNHRFISETDTEIIAHLIEEFNKTETIDKALFKSFKSLIGSNAIVILDLKTEKVIAARNGSPLVVGLDTDNNQYFLGSDVPPFLKYTNRVHFLKDGEAVIISKNGIKLFNIETEKEKKT